MGKTLLYILIVIIVCVGGIFFTITGHDAYLMTVNNDKLENDLVQHYNNTKSCPDIQYILNGSKEYWVHSSLYNKYSNLYDYLKCDEVLKK